MRFAESELDQKKWISRSQTPLRGHWQAGEEEQPMGDQEAMAKVQEDGAVPVEEMDREVDRTSPLPNQPGLCALGEGYGIFCHKGIDAPREGKELKHSSTLTQRPDQHNVVPKNARPDFPPLPTIGTSKYPAHPGMLDANEISGVYDCPACPSCCTVIMRPIPALGVLCLCVRAGGCPFCGCECSECAHEQG